MNPGLQNKLQGFLKNLQAEVDNKGRLNTIKEKTEESELRNRNHGQDQEYEEDFEEIS